MNHPFTVGQKIVCINDRFHPSICEWGSNYPRLNCVYTVKGVAHTPDGVSGIYGPGVLLAELNNPGDHLHFDASRLRPLTAMDKKETRKRVNQAFAKPRKAKIHAPPAISSLSGRSFINV